MNLQDEIKQQPEVTKTLLGRMQQVEIVAEAVKKRGISHVFLAARGSSDNAGLYAKYLWGSYNKMVVSLATPSLFSIYQTPPNIKDTLVVGISQSGESPDIASVLENATEQGAMTLAITNAGESRLGKGAEYVLDLHAGEEQAVAATKTYSAQLMLIALLSIVLADDQKRMAEIQDLPALQHQVLTTQPHVQHMVERFRYMQLCAVLGRGYNYATAYEWALKIKELSYVMAEPYSSADFKHGPLALVERGFPILAVIPDGKVVPGMLALLNDLVTQHKIELMAITNVEEVQTLAQTSIALPSHVPEWLSPLVAILPAQLFSFYLARVKGFDAEQPRNIQKVTRTT